MQLNMLKTLQNPKLRMVKELYILVECLGAPCCYTHGAFMTEINMHGSSF